MSGKSACIGFLSIQHVSHIAQSMPVQASESFSSCHCDQHCTQSQYNLLPEHLSVALGPGFARALNELSFGFTVRLHLLHSVLAYWHFLRLVQQFAPYWHDAGGNCPLSADAALASVMRVRTATGTSFTGTAA